MNHIGQWEGGLSIKKAENHGFICLLIFDCLAPSSDDHNMTHLAFRKLQFNIYTIYFLMHFPCQFERFRSVLLQKINLWFAYIYIYI